MFVPVEFFKAVLNLGIKRFSIGWKWRSQCCKTQSLFLLQESNASLLSTFLITKAFQFDFTESIVIPSFRNY